MSAGCYTKGDVRRAGKVFSDPAASLHDLENAKAVVGYWRAAHSAALQSMMSDLSKSVFLETDYLLAGRIKKFDTIVDKLRRTVVEPNGTTRPLINNLASMYDIAGCRIVVPDLASQEKLCETLLNLEACDRKASEGHNYIRKPKEDGYRGRHLIFRYPNCDRSYTLAVELQVRTERQHAWATAVEMHDAATGTRLKFDSHTGAVSDFFRLMSKIIEHHEENADISVRDLRENHESHDGIRTALNVLRTLKAASQSVSIIGELQNLDHFGYCLVDLNPTEQAIVLTGLDESTAFSAYLDAESNVNLRDHNFVLLKGASTEKLRQLYPNYFGDISTFVDYISDLVNKNLAIFA